MCACVCVGVCRCVHVCVGVCRCVRESKLPCYSTKLFTGYHSTGVGWELLTTKYTVDANCSICAFCSP